MTTQLQIAGTGKISGQVEFVAGIENLDAEFIRSELAAGRLVIPANKLHPQARRHRQDTYY
jgi:phosphomethylpyrimidine synthase